MFSIFQTGIRIVLLQFARPSIRSDRDILTLQKECQVRDEEVAILRKRLSLFKRAAELPVKSPKTYRRDRND